MPTTDHDGAAGEPRPTVAHLNRAILSGAVVPVIVRVIWSLALLLGATGIGIAGGYVVGLSRGRVDPTQFMLGNVREDEMGIGVAVATGLVMIVVAIGWWPTWRPLMRGTARLRAYWVPPLLVSVFAAALVTVLSVVIARQHWDDEEWAVIAVALVVGAGAVMAWLPVVARIDRLRVELDDGQSFPIRCLACGHDLRKSQHTTCPECGDVYTLEELLRGQGFLADVLRQMEAESAADDGDDGVVSSSSASSSSADSGTDSGPASDPDSGKPAS